MAVMVGREGGREGAPAISLLNTVRIEEGVSPLMARLLVPDRYRCWLSLVDSFTRPLVPSLLFRRVKCSPVCLFAFCVHEREIRAPGMTAC